MKYLKISPFSLPFLTVIALHRVKKSPLIIGIVDRIKINSEHHSASQSCPILSSNCSIIYVCFFYFAEIAQVWIHLHRQNVFYTVMLRKGSQVPQELRGWRRSKDEKGNQGVGGFRLTNILQLFSIYFFFSITLLYHFFSILFLPTTFTHTHTHDPHPRPLPTTHYI